jgi:hypothetical protein
MGIFRQLWLFFDDAVHLSNYLVGPFPALCSQFSGLTSIWGNSIVEVRGFLEDLDALWIKAQSSFEASLDLTQVSLIGQLKPNSPIYKLKCCDSIILLRHSRHLSGDFRRGF